MSINIGEIFETKSVELILRNNILIYCEKLPSGILSPCYYLTIVTMNVISSFAEELDLFLMDWEEYIAKTPNSERLCDLIEQARYEYYLTLISIVPT